MPIIDTTGIRPIERRQPTEGLERVRRRDEGGSGFRPQTNVNLKAAIQDIAATLGKIVAEEKTGIQRLPKEIGDVVKNILQQALSVESTLGKGIGSTIESQRFSMEQLLLFSRMLSQMGTLAERGYSMRLSEDTQTLMTQFKSLLVAQEGGEALEPVLVTKAAFELVDAKTAEQLPQALYEILSQLAQISTGIQQQPQPSSEGMQFLKQLIKFFMPRPGVDVTEKDLKQQAQNQSGQRGQSTSSSFLNSMFRTFGGRTQAQPQPQSQPTNQFSQPQAQGQPTNQFSQLQTQGQPTNQFTQPQTQPQGQPTNQFSQAQAQGQPTNQFTQPQAQGQPTNQFAQSQAQGQPTNQFTQPQAQSTTTQFNQPQLPLNQPPDQPVTKDFVTRQKEMRHQMKIAKESMIKQNMLNTPQTNDAMKGLAQFLLRGSQITPRDAALLQNFVNNSQQTMSETEARHLQNLLRLCQQNVPLTVQQAAVQQKLPDLPRLWAFMQMCDMANIAAKTNPRSYKRASKDIADFANAMRRAMTSENSIVQDKRSFQMMMPLYIGEDKTTYPTYLSIYDELERDEETGEDKKETWLRICVLTDYIGAAELVFRVYDETKLDMRFYFSRQDVAEEFRSIYLDDLRNSINQTQLNIGEVRVGGGSERMFSF